jgi:TPR repeat protein
VPANRGLFESPVRVARPSVYVCFIAILKLPFKFARHHRLQQAGKRQWATAQDKKIWGRVEHRAIQKDHADQSWTGAALGERDGIRKGDALCFRVLLISMRRRRSKQPRCRTFCSSVASIGRSGLVDLVAAHKWFNLAALKGRKDAIALRQEVAGQMSESEISAAQREARAWVSAH